jgi:hypothetical protein
MEGATVVQTRERVNRRQTPQLVGLAAEDVSQDHEHDGCRNKDVDVREAIREELSRERVPRRKHGSQDQKA